MMGQLLKAKEPAERIARRIAVEAEHWKRKGCTPKIAAIMVEGDPASSYYAQAKKKTAERLGIAFELHTFQRDAEQSIVARTIESLNVDPAVHGIMLELPLPKQMNSRQLAALIAPVKDVDGLTLHNKLATAAGGAGLYAVTPQSCIALLKHYGYPLEGQHAVIVGRGETVGQPLFHLLLRENATVTVCHSRTPDLRSHIQRADLLFVAAGRAGLITPDMVHSDLVVVDAGINETPGGGIAGDVDPDVAKAVKAMSPTPGGVGALTTTMLFANVLKALELQSAQSVVKEEKQG